MIPSNHTTKDVLILALVNRLGGSVVLTDEETQAASRASLARGVRIEPRGLGGLALDTVSTETISGHLVASSA